MNKRSPVQAIDRAFSILRLLAAEPEGLKAAEIAERLGLNQTTVHGLLRSLLNWDAVQQESRTGLYKIGLGIYELAQTFNFEAELKEKATPVLSRLAHELYETVNLGVLRNLQVFTLVEVVPERPLTAREYHSSGSPPHTQARGKVLLAFGDSRSRKAFRTRFHGLTNHDGSPFDFDAFDKELDHVRSVGYAEARHRPGGEVLSFSVPVFDSEGEVIAAIGLVVPTMRLAGLDREALIRRMQAAAGEIRDLLAPVRRSG